MMSSSPRRIMFYVQHLLGVGHVRRASLISSAMVQAGIDVHVVLGGMDVPGIDFPGAAIHRLPEAKVADAAFSAIVDDNGHAISEQWKDHRREQLLSLYGRIAPDVLLIELYPFGRRPFRFELLPLLETARDETSPPKIICSVRDLLVKKNKPERAIETADIINRYFDRVLVHGDPDFLAFDESFEETARIQEKLTYTGYVAPRSGPEGNTGHSKVIVAAGGGAVGDRLLKTAIEAKPLSPLSDRTWHILLGPNLDPAIREELEAIKQQGVIIEANRPDYQTLLANCALSISQAGYNTLMDLVLARCPAVVVPFADGHETEQTYRAQRLAEAGYLKIVADADLSPPALASAIDSALECKLPEAYPFRVDGAAGTADFITNL